MKKVKKELTAIGNEHLHQIHGGHVENTNTGSFDFGSIITILELPHIFMGFREFVNYSVDLYNGRSIEENDHFTRFFVDCKNKITGFFS